MSDVIQGKTRQGDFVHSSQGTAKAQGFKCVSRLWYPQTQAISDGIDQLLDDARSRDDILCPAKHMGLGLNEDNDIILEYLDGREFKPTVHAFKQLAQWCKLSTQYVKDMCNPVLKQNGEIDYQRDRRDAESFLDSIKNGWRRLDPDKNFRFRTYSDGTLRAMLSERYAIIDNVWYLETLAELFKEIGGDEPRLSHWRGDADTIYGNILIPDTCRADQDSDYGGMLSISNCEIGIRRLTQLPSVFRAICMNGCIWDQEKGHQINKVHRGEINLHDLKRDLTHNLNDQIPLLNEGVERFLALRDKAVEKNVKLANVFAQIAIEHKLAFGADSQIAKVVNLYSEHEADNRNLFGIVNAITRAGQEYSPSEWVRFDEVAGTLMNLNDNEWTNLQNRARAMSTKQFDKVYGRVTAA